MTGRTVAIALLLVSAVACNESPRGASYDLLDEQPVLSDANPIRLDVGGSAARSFLLRGWGKDEVDSGGTTFAWGVGGQSALKFLVTTPEELQLRFRCQPHDNPEAEAQTVSFAVNDTPLSSVRLVESWHAYQLAVPGDALRPGANELVLSYAYARSETPSSEKDAPRELAVCFDWLELEALVGDPETLIESDRLFIPVGRQLTYLLSVPPRTRLTFERIEVEGEGGSALEVEVESWRTEKATTTLTRTDEVSSVPLSTPSGMSLQPVRLSLRAVSRLGSGESEGLAVVAPTIVSEEPFDRPTVRRPNIIIYLIDTLRADHLGCYGYPSDVSPHIDTFADQAVLFEKAIAQSSWTRTSVASILTGLHPPTHGTIERADRLSNDAPTLAEVLRWGGYETAAFVSNGNVSSQFGFDRGFETFNYLPEDDQTPEMHQLSDEVNEHVFEWLAARNSSAPLLLYVHTTDPHGPYTPPPKYRSRFASHVDDVTLGTTEWLLDNWAPAERDQVIEHVESLYDAEIAFNDANFGEFLAELDRHDLFDSSLVVLLSDHGEEFREHFRIQHGKSAYTESIDIPLIIRFPDSAGIPPRRVDHLVEQVDLYPTVLEYLGIAPPAPSEGDSLLDLVRPPYSRDNRPVYSSVALGSGIAECVIDRRWKLIRIRSRDDSRVVLELYDQRDDPLEKTNLVNSRRKIATRLLADLDAYLAHRESSLQPAKAVIEGELRQRLRKLGYVK